MNIFIVYSHPDNDSFNHSLLKTSQRVLTDLGHSVRVSDLYEKQFNPAASFDDFTVEKDPEHSTYMMMQKKAASQNAFSQDIKEEMDNVLWADVIIFHFPIWWFNPPAMLKGWIDRVFALDVTWGFGAIYDKGLLKGKKALTVVTTGGGQELYQANGPHQQTIEQIMHNFQHGTLEFCGMNNLKPFIAWTVFQAGSDGREQYLKDYESHLKEVL